MRKQKRTFVGWLLAAITLTAAPAVAQQAAVSASFHFADQNGQVHTVTDEFVPRRGGDIDRLCLSDIRQGPIGLIRAEIAKHPELAGMKYVGGSCARDSFGDIKPAQSAVPHTYRKVGQADDLAGNFPIKLDSDLVDGPARIVILRYQAPNGKIVKVSVGATQGRTAFHERDCAEIVKNKIKVILGSVNASYAQNVLIGNRYPYDIRTLKFIGADCVAPPSDYAALMKMIK